MDGKGKQSCTRCGYRSIRGMARGHGLCPYHWNFFMWGQPWADLRVPNFQPKPRNK